MLFAVEGLRYAYAGTAPVLDGLDLALAPGERLFVTGPNGSGKSTLLRCLVGLARPSAGRVVAFGRDRRTEVDFREVRARAGYVFQDPDDQLFCPTVAEDVAFGPLNLGRSRTEAAAAVERTLGALHLLHLRDRVTYRLSGGERRLVAVATVLAMEPEVLLLDEPTNALDEATTRHLTEILLGLPQAMIVVSHDPAFRRALATREAAMEGGRLA